MKIFTIILLIALAIAGITVGYVFDFFTPEEPDTTHEHAFGEWETKFAPNCTDAEVERRVCECGEEETREGEAATGHRFGEWITRTEPTCESVGEEYQTCTCGLEETREIPASDHNYTPVVTAPTCTEAGYTTYTCTCSDSYVADSVDALDHNMVATSDDTHHWTVCANNCGNETEKIAHTAESISAASNISAPMETMVVKASDLTVTATCSCGKTFAVTDGVELEGATLALGANTVTVKYGELSATVVIEAAEVNVILSGSVVEDTYLSSNSTSAKDTDYSERDALGTYSSYYRAYLKYNFKDIIENPLFAANKDKAKIQFVFTLSKGAVTDESSLTFGGFIPSESFSNIDFSDLYWNNVISSGAYPELNWGNAVNLVSNTADGHNFTYDDKAIVLTFTYDQIKEFIDESYNAIFTLRISKTSGISIASLQNTQYAIPAVNVILNNDHFHAYTEQVTEDKYLVSANCEEKAKYYYSCSCGEAGTKTFEYGDVIAHVFGDWETLTPATCTEAEVEVRKCACGKEETQTGDAAFDHEMITKFDVTNHWTECDREGCDEATKPVAHFGGTATETEQAVCEGCNQPYGGLATHEHSYGAWETKTPATCTEAEVEFRKCACGKEETQTGDAALGHNMQTKFDENNHWTECANNCGETTEPTAHFGGEATIFAQAACETCGQLYGEKKNILVDDTYVDSASGNTTKDRSEATELRASSSSSTNRRTYLRLDLSDIINNSDFAAYNATAKLQFTFVLNSNSAAVDGDTKFSLYTFNVTDEATKNVAFANLNWNSVKSAADYGQLAFNGGTKIMDAKTTSDDGVAYDDTTKTITLTINYSDIESYIDASTGCLFIGFSTNVGLRVHSSEATDAASRPTIEYIYNN